MFGTLAYLLSIGVIGLVSAVWLRNYIDFELPSWFPLNRSSSQQSPPTNQPPQLPKRPNQNKKETENHAKQTNTSQHNTNTNASSTSTVSSTTKSTPASSNLLSMALNSPPALPKRPMINILHAPTLTKSFSPSHAAEEASAEAAAPPAGPLSPPSEEKLAAHREQVQWEIVSSEEKYIAGLNTLMSVYFHPLKAKADKGSSKLTRSDFHLLFSNIESIWKFHQMFLPALKTTPGGDVAAAIQAHADYFKIYVKYVADYSPALQTMNKLHRNPDFKRFLKQQRDSPLSEGMDILSLLITPVQRIPRYLLLLRELQKYTPSSHPHSHSIIAAIAKVEKIAAHINESQRHHENASILLEFQHQIHNLPEEIILFQPHRRLVRHGILTLLKQEGTATQSLKSSDIGGKFGVILFNDQCIYTTQDHEYRGLLKLQGCTLNIDNLVVELYKPKSEIHRVPMLLRFECPSLEETEKWSTSLREGIQTANELNEKDERRRSAASNSISK